MTTETPIRRPLTLLDPDDLPEDVVGEIIDGELHVHPRPDDPHGRAALELILTLGNPFHHGVGGPGGWVLRVEPRIQFGSQSLVPDLAGWRQERFVAPKKGALQIAPDWICEILSPSTAGYDRVRKLPIYATHEVRHAWLIDPLLRTLEVLRLEGGAWVIVGAFQGDEKVRAEPFDAVEIDLAQLWGEYLPSETEELDDTTEG